MAPCCRCTELSEQPGTSTWWGKGRYKYMNGKTSDIEPSEPPAQLHVDADSDEEEKLEKKLDAKPVPVMPLGLAPPPAAEGRPPRPP